jgi:hypothetical protein
MKREYFFTIYIFLGKKTTVDLKKLKIMLKSLPIGFGLVSI